MEREMEAVLRGRGGSVNMRLVSCPWCLLAVLGSMVLSSPDVITDMGLDLRCDPDAMRLRVLKSVLAELSVNTSALHTSQQRCRVPDTSLLYVAVTLSHENHTLCATSVKVNGTHLIYSNELSASDPSEQPDRISRTASIQIKFSCVYHYDRVVSLPCPIYIIIVLVTFYVKEGEFNVTMTLHPTPDFLDPYAQSPVIPLSRRLYIQLQIHGQGPRGAFTLRLDQCWATPGADHGGRVRHLLIADGRSNDSTVLVMKSLNLSVSRFSLQMFHFVTYPQVYIHCRIWLCQPNSSHCCERPRPSIGRYRREQDDPYRKVVSCGPIQLSRSTVSSVEHPEAGLRALLLPAAFAAGAALFLLVMVTAAKAVKKFLIRKSRLPSAVPRLLQ